MLVLTGTDYYRFQFTQAADFAASLEAANVLVSLHDLAYRSIPERFHSKLVVIKQAVAFKEEGSSNADDASAPPEPPDDSLLSRLLTSPVFPIAVIGHLRAEKDPFITARAAHLLPVGSGIQVLHAGAAHSREWAAQARTEMTRNVRYHWLGELNRHDTQHLLRQARLMVISSVMEGGANIVSEACVLGLPILASNIDGNMGLLGSDYPGLFEVGNVDALRAQLHRCETDPDYLTRLRELCQRRGSHFSPALESAGLLDSIARACSVSK
ncbi:hypothetical protein GCM10022278_31590 [Allohahella marinimesophila]|uniref:Glycosyl transferase family 1 domain-containing protein n=1 Tax=Allohahella marinimesophila TaxID=1054972 RepID=A0ABP7PVB7_9GAMM